jgi:hypothetical protein
LFEATKMTAAGAVSHPSLFATLGVPVFLVREAGDGVLEVHTTARRRRDEIGRKVRLAAADEVRRCRVIVHSARALRRAKSLEALNEKLSGGPILHDPTGFVTRVAALVDCAARLRRLLGRQVQAIYLEANHRTVFVVLDRAGCPAATEAALAHLMERIGTALEDWRSGHGDAPHLAFRVGFTAPRGARLVPIDNRSVRARSPLLQRLRLSALRATLATSLAALLGTAAHAEPAVSSPNLLIGAQAGTIDDDLRGSATVSGAVPLGDVLGAQVEAAAGGSEYAGGAGHLFWRNPNWGTFGFVGSYETYQGLEMSRFGVEAELYLSSLTFSLRGGYQDGDVDSGAWGRADLGFYVDPNLLLTGGIERTPDETYGRIGAELQPAVESLPGLSLFADSSFGGDRAQVMAGIRFYFGSASTTLVDRHRRDQVRSALGNFAPLVDARHEALANAGSQGYGAGGL